MKTGETIEEDSFEYEGEVAQAGAAAIPVIQTVGVAMFSAAATAMVQNMMAPDVPAMPGAAAAGLVKPEEQPIEPTDTLKEQELLAAETKRKKQGFLQSFGGLPEEVNSFGLI